MTQLLEILSNISISPILPSQYQAANAYTFRLTPPSDFNGIASTDTKAMMKRTYDILTSHNAIWGIGTYAEQRSLYTHPQYKDSRNIHLGIDLCVPAGTIINAPISGVIHSFANNSESGDYGPTLILQHDFRDVTFYTLYGHLSHRSLKQYKAGHTLHQGCALGTVGSEKENGEWPPHLHLQLIKDIGAHKGNYPGTCKLEEKDFYFSNCPDPTPLLQFEPNTKGTNKTK